MAPKFSVSGRKKKVQETSSSSSSEDDSSSAATTSSSEDSSSDDDSSSSTSSSDASARRQKRKKPAPKSRAATATTRRSAPAKETKKKAAAAAPKRRQKAAESESEASGGSDKEGSPRSNTKKHQDLDDARNDGGTSGLRMEMFPFPHPMTYFGPLIRHPHPSNPAAGARMMPLLKPYRGVAMNNNCASVSSVLSAQNSIVDNGTPTSAAAASPVVPPPLLPFVDILDACAVIAPVAGSLAALHLATIQQQNAADSAIKSAGVLMRTLKGEPTIRHLNSAELVVNTFRLVSADTKGLEALEVEEEGDDDISEQDGSEDEEGANNSKEARREHAATRGGGVDDEDADDSYQAVELEKDKVLGNLKKMLSVRHRSPKYEHTPKAKRTAAKSQAILSAMLQRLKRCIFLSYSTAGPPSSVIAVDPSVCSPYGQAFQRFSAGGGLYYKPDAAGRGTTTTAAPSPQYSSSPAHGLHCLFFDQYCDASDYLLRANDGFVCGPASDATGYSEPTTVTEAKKLLSKVGATESDPVVPVAAAAAQPPASGDKGTAADRKRDREQAEKEKAKASMLNTSNCPPSFNQHLAHYGVFPAKCQTTAIAHVATVLGAAVTAPSPSHVYTSPRGTLNAIVACDIKAAAIAEEGRVVIVGLVPNGAAAPSTYTGAHQPLNSMKLQRVAALSLPSGYFPTSIAVEPLCPQSSTYNDLEASEGKEGGNGGGVANGLELRPNTEITTKFRMACDHISSDAVKGTDYYLRTTVSNFIQFSKDVLTPFGKGMGWGSGNCGQKLDKKNTASAHPAGPLGAPSVLPDVRIAIGTQHLRVFICVVRVVYNTTVIVQSEVESVKEAQLNAEQLRERERERTDKRGPQRGGLVSEKLFLDKKSGLLTQSASAAAAGAVVMGTFQPKPLVMRVNKAAMQCLSPSKSEFFVLRCVGAGGVPNVFSPITALSFGLPSDYKYRFYAALGESLNQEYHGAGAHAPLKPPLVGRTFLQYAIASQSGRKGCPGFLCAQTSSRDACEMVLSSNYDPHGQESGEKAKVTSSAAASRSGKASSSSSSTKTQSSVACLSSSAAAFGNALGNFASAAFEALDSTPDEAIVSQYNRPCFIDTPTSTVDSFEAAAVRTNFILPSDPLETHGESGKDAKRTAGAVPSSTFSPGNAIDPRQGILYNKRHPSASSVVHFVTPSIPSQTLFLINHGSNTGCDWCFDVGAGPDGRFGNPNPIQTQTTAGSSASAPVGVALNPIESNTFELASGVQHFYEKTPVEVLGTNYPFFAADALVDATPSALYNVQGAIHNYLSLSGGLPQCMDSTAEASVITPTDATNGTSGLSMITPTGVASRLMGQLKLKAAFAGAFLSHGSDGDKAHGVSRAVQACAQIAALKAEIAQAVAVSEATPFGSLQGAGALGGGSRKSSASTTNNNNKATDASSSQAAAGSVALAKEGPPMPHEGLPFVQIFSHVHGWPAYTIPLDTFGYFKSVFETATRMGVAPTGAAAATDNGAAMSTTAESSFRNVAPTVVADPAAAPSVASNDVLALKWLPRIFDPIATPNTPEKIAAHVTYAGNGCTATVLLKALEGVLANEPVLLPELLAVMRRNQIVVVAFK